MQQNDGRRRPPAMRATSEVLEAEQRASTELSAILKSLAAGHTLASREGSWRWAEFRIMLAGLKFGGLNSTSAKRILRDGIIPRLIKYLNEFRFLANKSNAAGAGGPQNIHPWYFAMFTLESLADLLRDSSLPESLELLAEYRRFGGGLISTYNDAAALWWEPGEVRGDPNLEMARISCFASLMPLVEESFCGGLVPIDNWDVVYAITPLIAGLRQSIRQIPSRDTAQFFAEATAKTLNDCILTICVMESTNEGNVEKMTGLPYFELVRQCVTSAGHDPEDLKTPIVEINLLISMIQIDGDPDFQDVIASQKIVTWSASIMRLAMSHHESIFVSVRQKGRRLDHQLYDRMISTFKIILDRACVTGDDRAAVEAVNCGVLHLVEVWSRDASRKLENIRSIGQSISSLVTTPHIRARMEIQLRNISVRMKNRREIDPEIARTWEDAYESNGRLGRGAPVDTAPVCAMLGCESAVPADMLCSRCMCTYYCSQVCQKSDWKWHKPYCKKLKINSK